MLKNKKKQHLENNLFLARRERSPNVLFYDFRVILGVSWDPLWAPFCDFPMILGARMGDWFQVHVFSDPWMEMMPDCRGCILYDHCKTDVFERFHFFHFFTKFVSRGWF